MKRLGKSDLFVSEISFGCMSLENQPLQSERLLRKAFDNGINFFDTADLYDKGQNEKLVGQAFKSIRKEVIIATKAGNQWRSDGSGWDWNPSKTYILQCADESLKRLQTDYIDLYQLHGGTIDDPIDETIEAFELLKQQGKIRWYGISSIRPNVIREYVKRSHIVSVMTQYSLLDHRPEEMVLDLLAEHNIGVVTRGAVAQGRLLGRKEGDYLQFSAEEVALATQQIQTIAQNLHRDRLAIALAYVLSNPAVVSAVTGIRTDEQLNEAIAALQNQLILNKEQLNELRAQVKKFVYNNHR